MNITQNCPCGSDKPYRDCCEPMHQGKSAKTAEALMRSRYSADLPPITLPPDSEKSPIKNHLTCLSFCA